MQSFYSSKKLITNINGKQNYSEEIVQSSNEGGIQRNNIVFRQTAEIEGRLYLVSLQILGEGVKLILIDLETGNMIEKLMNQEEIIIFFKNINKTLPKLKDELHSLSGKKGIKDRKQSLSSEKTSKKESSSPKKTSKKESSSEKTSEKDSSSPKKTSKKKSSSPEKTSKKK